MKPLTPLLVALVVAPPTAFFTNALAAPAADVADESARNPSPDGELPTRLEALDARLEDIGRAAGERAGSSRREALDAFGPAVTEALAARGLRVDAAALEATRAASAQVVEARLARVAAALEAEDAMALAELFEELEADGAVGEVLAALRARSEADPADVGAALDLARAASAAMDTSPYGPRSVAYGEVADDAFVRVLETDPDRDGVRLERARLLARAPVFLGLRSEAIGELEEVVLRGESGGTPEPEAYRLLGTLLLEQGAQDAALDAWRRGAGTFPDHEELARLLELHERR